MYHSFLIHSSADGHLGSFHILAIINSAAKNIADLWNRIFDSVGEVEGGMFWENGIEKCIISYKKQIASLGSMQDTGCLGLVHWDNPERWYGEGGGRGVQNWEQCKPVADSC